MVLFVTKGAPQRLRLLYFCTMKNYLSLVKFSHTIFALPFALTGYALGVVHAGKGISWISLSLVVLCMVFARSAAMAFNRYVDRDIDATNPRTQTREIPAGIISPKAALLFIIANCLAFVLCTWFINPICFYLSPVALLVVLGYSYTKRFTFLCHLVLGIGLGLAPVGAFLAVTGYFDPIPIYYGLAVFTWVAGFDIIYALQDEAFDRSKQLYSIPAAFGKKRALKISEWLHLLTAFFMVWAARTVYAELLAGGWLLWTGTALFLILLVWQHFLVKPEDLSRVNLAFFTTNGMASLIFGAFTVLDLLT